MKKQTQFQKYRQVIGTYVLAMAIVAGAVCAAHAAAKQAFTGTVNINSASVEELMQLPGIGQSKAQAIVAYRTQSPFKAAQDLMNVKGIGEKLFSKIETHVMISGQNTVGAKTEKPGASEAASR